jgi:eukaryotic-like serine/threonine-protein kinase
MATVYLAEDLKHERKVALKVLKPELAAVLGAERFVQEIKTTAALQHPHILPLFDSGTAGRLPVLCDAVHRRRDACATS